MTKIIGLNIKSCKNCYKCIRACPVKAISFRDDGANVIEQECVLCGTCVECCPQDAKVIRDDLPRVRELIASGRKVYVSVAPSWESYFAGMSFEALSGRLRALGFAGVEETAIGAAATSGAYQALLKEGRMPNIITTACPSVVMMVEEHFPELIGMLSPVYSPMVAHAKLMREAYGEISVVFLGPCLSKMKETEDPLNGSLVNFALTFTAAEQWLKGEAPADCGDFPASGTASPLARLYPKPSGILQTIPESAFLGYRSLAVDGFDSCIELFGWLRDSGETGYFIEANLCKGGCLGGPVMRLAGKLPYRANALLDGLAKERDRTPAPSSGLRAGLNRGFTSRKVKNPEPTEEELRSILAQIGKTTPEQELNCGGCGYPTCRDKARAVFWGKADLKMCLPYFRERAENISNTVISYSPNGIVAFDQNFLVVDLNPMAEQIFGVSRSEVIGGILPDLCGDDGFAEAERAGAAFTKPLVPTALGLITEQTFIHIQEQNLYMVFVKDVTADEKQREKLEALRLTTVEAAQKVIDKQMMVAQEIASLLGETTAETKVVLTRLKKSMNAEGEGQR